MADHVYTPQDDVAGSGQIRTVRAVIKSGESFSRLTPLMRDAVDKSVLVKWDGDLAKQPIALSACSADALAANTLQSVYDIGCFRISAIQWPANADTDAERRSAFLGTGLAVENEL